MKIKTSELSGAALDWAVAKCSGLEVKRFADRLYYVKGPDGVCRDAVGGSYSPSTDWSQGGPIIERAEIELLKWGIDGWEAKDTNYQFLNTPQERPEFSEGCGSTPLIAAMRCYVASKLGDEVEVPDELMKEV